MCLKPINVKLLLGTNNDKKKKYGVGGSNFDTAVVI